MEKEKIYVVKNIFKRLATEGWHIDNISFRDMDKAIAYCESKMTEEEKAMREKALRRKLINWYEFFTKDYIYEIKVIDLV
jgi:hypothetical protein